MSTTLHEKLQPFLKDLIHCVLKDAPILHYKYKKYKEMPANPEYIPTVCQSVGMKFQAINKSNKESGLQDS
jgi:hypothetical protein